LRLLLALLTGGRSASAQQFSVWGGGGAGSFLSGGPRDVEGQQFGALAISFAGDRLRLRYIRGSFEREKGLPPNIGDADVDYWGGDVVLTRRLTRLPVDLAVGVGHFKEAAPARLEGESSGRVLVGRWGPRLSAARDFPVWKPLLVWTELDVNYALYRPRQVVAFLDAGIGLRF
jgi:hypothetical protein